jgi:hypothetical protein
VKIPGTPALTAGNGKTAGKQRASRGYAWAAKKSIMVLKAKQYTNGYPDL